MFITFLKSDRSSKTTALIFQNKSWRRQAANSHWKVGWLWSRLWPAASSPVRRRRSQVPTDGCWVKVKVQPKTSSSPYQHSSKTWRRCVHLLWYWSVISRSWRYHTTTGTGELMTSHTTSAVSPWRNSCGDSTSRKVSLSVASNRTEV